MTGLAPAQAEVWSVVQRLNEGWRTNRLELLSPLFHEEALIVDIAHQPLAVGREACVESYRAFVTSATVESYVEEPPQVTLFGPTALVTYAFRIRYALGEQSYEEAGSDCLVLTRGSSSWLVAWRQLVWRAA